MSPPRQDERLNTEFSQTDFTLDEGEQLLRDMQQLRDAMASQAEVIQDLEERAHQVTPQRQRREHLPGPMPVSAICNYKSANVSAAIWLVVAAVTNTVPLVLCPITLILMVNRILQLYFDGKQLSRLSGTKFMH